MWRPRLIVLQPTPYCNINCDYCYLGNRDDRRLMTPAVVDAIRDKLFARMAADASPRIVWHAGEPTVVPVAWYESAYEKLRPVTPSGAVFAVQTNGIAISAAWIEFLRRSGTQVGMSIDGPQRFHDARRKTRAGTPTWALVMENLRKLQSGGIRPNVITVLHRESLFAPDDFYGFYRDNDIGHVSFSIDEANGANGASSFDAADGKAAMTAFLRRILDLAFAEGYRLHIREIERIAQLLTEDIASHNEQVQPWDVVAVAANGNVTSFSPDFMELRSPDHNDFCFGNILENDFDELVGSEIFKRTAEEIRVGVELCRTGCGYFGVCGGGSPSNKMSENGSLKSGETQFCKLSIQAPADALVEFLAGQGAVQIGSKALNTNSTLQS
jgi:uncharacterized protein